MCLVDLYVFVGPGSRSGRPGKRAKRRLFFNSFFASFFLKVFEGFGIDFG